MLVVLGCHCGHLPCKLPQAHAVLLLEAGMATNNAGTPGDLGKHADEAAHVTTGACEEAEQGADEAPHVTAGACEEAEQSFDEAPHVTTGTVGQV